MNLTEFYRNKLIASAILLIFQSKLKKYLLETLTLKNKSVPKKSIASAVVFYYCACYTFFSERTLGLTQKIFQLIVYP